VWRFSDTKETGTDDADQEIDDTCTRAKVLDWLFSCGVLVVGGGGVCMDWLGGVLRVRNGVYVFLKDKGIVGVMRCFDGGWGAGG
jgi:hypothetical protein